MKFLDKVKVIKNREDYLKEDVHEGMVGTIIDAEIRDNCFNVIFVDDSLDETDNKMLKDDIICAIRIVDLILIKDMNCSDDIILNSIPKNNPNWWCKVENGFILNLKGKKKNAIPYDYNS